MKIQALCTDIDGTLLDSRRELSTKTKSIFASISSRMPVILASSRMPSAMTHLQEELNIVGHPLIAYNGGYVIKYEKGLTEPKVYDSVFIPAVVCDSINNMAEGTDINVSLYFEDKWFAPRMDYWTEREERITKVKSIITDVHRVISSWKDSGSGAHKVMCMGPEHEIGVLAKQLHEKHGNEIHVYFSRPTYLELAPRRISKATALKLILSQEYQIQMESVLAFGDNYNDIDMLRSVGLGVAVDNAREEVKAVAKEVTSKSVEDGVALTIEKYLSTLFIKP